MDFDFSQKISYLTIRNFENVSCSYLSDLFSLSRDKIFILSSSFFVISKISSI